MECVVVECAMPYSSCNWNGQEDFNWKEMGRISINLFKVRRNNHLVSYVSLMYRYGIKYKHILFDIFLWRTLINSYKMSIINHKLTIYAILCQNVTMFYQREKTSLSKVQENVKIYKNSKWNFSSCCLQVTVM